MGAGINATNSGAGGGVVALLARVDLGQQHVAAHLAVADGVAGGAVEQPVLRVVELSVLEPAGRDVGAGNVGQAVGVVEARPQMQVAGERIERARSVQNQNDQNADRDQNEQADS